MRACLRRGVPVPDAEELAQEALRIALESKQRPDAAVPLPAWVYGIARNLSRDFVKSARRREQLTDAVPEDATADELATVVAVRHAVHELPPPLRDVVTLHELEEYSLRETAAALAIPFDTAKDRLRRARDELRARFAELDTAVATERTHSRRRASRSANAVVAGALALLGTGVRSAAASVLGAKLVWLALASGAVLFAGGVAVGRLTAPAVPPTEPAPPVALVARPPNIEPPPAPTPAPVVDAGIVESGVADVGVTAPRRVPIPDPASAPEPTPAAAAAPPRTSDEAERLLLDRARAALHRNLAADATVTLMTHAREFPRGRLAEERDVLLIEAYVASGNARLARERVAHYVATYPTGVLRSRVNAITAALAPAP